MVLKLKKKILNNLTNIKVPFIKKKSLTYNFQKNIVKIELNYFTDILSKNYKISNKLKRILENSSSIITKEKELIIINKFHETSYYK